MRHKVVTQHGEARTLFYVVDTEAPEDEQPAVIATYETREQADARALVEENTVTLRSLGTPRKRPCPVCGETHYEDEDCPVEFENEDCPACHERPLVVGKTRCPGCRSKWVVEWDGSDSSHDSQAEVEQAVADYCESEYTNDKIRVEAPDGRDYQSIFNVAIRPMEPYAAAAETITEAIRWLRVARDLLVEAGAPKAADRVRAALRSAAGAQRNAEAAPYRAERKDGAS